MVRFIDSTLGLKRPVGEGISCFFKHVYEEIILEDDCVPTKDFFFMRRLGDALLSSYRNDDRVSVATGNNFQSGKWQKDSSSYFSQYAHVWGWDAWKRAWNHNDPEMKFWPGFRNSSEPHAILGRGKANRYWRNVLDDVHAKKFESTFDYPWQATIRQNGGLTATPNVNLVRNIGFGIFSTHEIDVDSTLSTLYNNSGGSLIPPKGFFCDKRTDTLKFSSVFTGKNPYWESLFQRLNELREIINWAGRGNLAK